MALQLEDTTQEATAAAAPLEIKASTQKRTPNTEVRGQVRMHAIKSGYDVAALLAATIANGPEGVKATLHQLAKEVAAEIEAYTFGE